jgi:HEPN domain-containing protein
VSKAVNNSQFIEDWKKIAKIDWERVGRNLKDRDAVAAGFFLQQCLEKYLKAFLLTHGWKLKKIHRLDTLLDEAVNHDESLQAFYELSEAISGYYRADRYPPLGTEQLACEDIEKDLEEAKRFILTMFPEEKLGL